MATFTLLTVSDAERGPRDGVGRSVRVDSWRCWVPFSQWCRQPSGPTSTTPSVHAYLSGPRCTNAPSPRPESTRGNWRHPATSL